MSFFAIVSAIFSTGGPYKLFGLVFFSISAALTEFVSKKKSKSVNILLGTIVALIGAL